MFVYFVEILDCEIKLVKVEGKYMEGVSDFGGFFICIELELKMIFKDSYYG